MSAVQPTAPPPAARTPLLGRRYTLELRQQVSAGHQAAVLLAALAAGLLVSAAILVAAGVSPRDLVQEFIVQTLFDAQNLRAVLFQAAPMVMVGLAAAVAFRARFWNLGLEGQMVCGAIAATALTLYDVGPTALRLPLMVAAALAGGLAWATLPALLKLRLGVNEIIATLMLNYLAANLLLHLVYGPWKDPQSGFPHSPAFSAAERLPELGGGIHSAILVAGVVALLAAWGLGASRIGLYLRFVHAQPQAAQALGVPVARVTLAAVLVSGALAGLAGLLVASGQEGRLTQAFYTGYGFSGVLIAFLARNHPLAATVVALLIATLFVAGRNLQVFYQIPFSMVQLIQAILVIAVASADFFLRHRLRAVAPAA